MKKHFILLAGSAVLFASCGSNNNSTGQSQAQIDSSVNAKLAEHDAANAAKNDSTLKAMEKEKAEALAKEHEHEHTATKKHEGGKKVEPDPVATPAPPPPPPPGGMRGHADQNANNPGNTGAKSGGGMRAHADQNQGK